eukprot:3967412-Alexandrium_andersonii.AAC.1
MRRADPLEGVEQLNRPAAPSFDRGSEAAGRGPSAMRVHDLRQDHDPARRRPLSPSHHLGDRLDKGTGGATPSNDQSDR